MLLAFFSLLIIKLINNQIISDESDHGISATDGALLSVKIRNSTSLANVNSDGGSCQTREARWPINKVVLRCDSPNALIDYVIKISNSDVNTTFQFNAIELICSHKKLNNNMNKNNNNMNSFINNKLTSIQLDLLSIQNCNADSFNVLPFFNKVKLLNMSCNYFPTFPWINLIHTEVQILDLRNNFFDCSNCANKWIYFMSTPNFWRHYFSLPGSTAERQGQLWEARSIYHFIPQRIFVNSTSFYNNTKSTHCTFDHCPVEKVIFKPEVVDTVVGAFLQFDCRFETNFITENFPVSISSLNPFQWLFRDSDFNEPEKNDNNSKITNATSSIKKPYNVQWNASRAILTKDSATSHDLGFVACKCYTCSLPIFNVSQVRFKVNVTANVRDHVDSAGDSQLIVHGYPLEKIRLRVTRLKDNSSEQQILSEINYFLNDTFIVKYQDEHSHFFLKYYLLYIHECTNCNQAAIQDDYLLQICQNVVDCVEKVHKFSFRTANTISASNTVVRNVFDGNPDFVYVFAIALLIAFLVAMIWLVSHCSWKIKRKIPILQYSGWELKRRRISRNTNRTDETSIPLEDTISNTGLSTSYSFIAQHVPMINPNEIHVKYKIGRGAFGEVFIADWLPNKEKVAVKTLHIHMDAEMDKEAAMLAKLDHVNVLRLYGITNINNKIALVMEMMSQGDLKTYLKAREPRCDNYSQFPPALLQIELINISVQLCAGLSYLVSKQVVHRDLAARNCLVSGESDANICSSAFRPPIVVKISDFGMSRRLYSDAEYYRMHDAKTALPVRWLPPECLSIGKFTHQSDMWSFGVTLYEIFTYGGMPFGNLSNGEVITAVVSGVRPEIPSKCPPQVCDVMRQCFFADPSERISADDALIRLSSLY